jgi:hypothetical protein
MYVGTRSGFDPRHPETEEELRVDVEATDTRHQHADPAPSAHADMEADDIKMSVFKTAAASLRANKVPSYSRRKASVLKTLFGTLIS